MKVYPTTVRKVIQSGGNANLAVGPDFGGTTPTTGGALSLTDLDLTANLGLGVGASLESLLMYSELGAGASLAWGPGLTANVTMGAAVDGSVVVSSMKVDGDTYLDQQSPTTTRGSESVVNGRTPNASGNNERLGYLAWDLTEWSGTVTSAVATIYASTSGVTDENGSVGVFTHPTAPFVESTATWNNSNPVPGTSRGTLPATYVPSPSFAAITLTFDATMRANMLGNWLYLEIRGVTPLSSTQVQVRSRSHSNTSSRPSLTFTVEM